MGVFLLLCGSLFALDYESFPASSDAYPRQVFAVISQIGFPIRHRKLAGPVWHGLCVVLCVRSGRLAAAGCFLVLSTALAREMGLGLSVFCLLEATSLACVTAASFRLRACT